MSHNQSTFIDLCLSGRASVDEIDDFVDLWHGGGTDIPLHDYLGLTRPEYALWVEKPESLKYIISSRKNGQPTGDFPSVAQTVTMAARAGSPEDAEEMVEWLKRTGRIED